MNSQKNKEVQKVWAIILEVITKQGLSFILLVAMAYYFQTQTIHLQNKTDQCNERLIEMYKQEAQQSREVIRENTEAINNFSHYLRENAKR